MNKKSKQNYIYYTCYVYAKKALPLFYILTLFYLAIGLSYSQIALLSVIGNGATLLSEVPTGVIADRWSRKRSLQFAEILKLFSVITMLFCREFAILCISSGIWGIADALQSGADQALIYESFQNKEEYQRFLSKIYSKGYVVSAIATAASPFLLSVNTLLPIYLSVFLLIVGLWAVCNLVDPEKIEQQKEEKLKEGNVDLLLKIYRKKSLVKILVLMSICTVTVMTVNSYTQPLVLNKGVELKILGIIMFTYNILMAAGAKIAKNMDFRGMHYLVAGSMGIFAVVAGWTNLPICILAISGFRLCNGIIWPVLTYRVNKLLESKIRATVLSFQSMGTSILAMIIDSISGIVIDRVGLSLFYVGFGICITGCIFALVLSEDKHIIWSWHKNENKRK